MIRLFLLLLACVAGAWYVAEAIKQHGPGYVYIYLHPYSLETSIWFGLLLLAGLVAGLYLVTRIVVFILYQLVAMGYLPRHFLRRRAGKLHYQGQVAFLGENWRLASKKLGKAARYSETPFMDYVMAARASLAAGDVETARQHAAHAGAAVDVDPAILALLQLDIARLESGVLQQQFLLEKMLQEHGHTPGLLGRALDIYQREKQWEKLQALLPAIRKHKLLDDARWRTLQEQVRVATGGRPAPGLALKQVWEKAGKALAGKSA